MSSDMEGKMQTRYDGLLGQDIPGFLRPDPRVTDEQGELVDLFTERFFGAVVGKGDRDKLVLEILATHEH